MKTIKIWNDNPADNQLRDICSNLEEGRLVIIPTDTLYAIACDSRNPKAIARVCQLKGINPDKTSLSILCSDISMASEYSRFDNYAFHLLKELTPGPYTFLFKAAPVLPKAFKGRKTVGVRIPDARTPREIARCLGRPLMSASIHFDSDDYAVNPELIAENYEGKVELILIGEDGLTTPSTVIDCTGREPVTVRMGLGQEAP